MFIDTLPVLLSKTMSAARPPQPCAAPDRGSRSATGLLIVMAEELRREGGGLVVVGRFGDRPDERADIADQGELTGFEQRLKPRAVGVQPIRAAVADGRIDGAQLRDGDRQILPRRRVQVVIACVGGNDQLLASFPPNRNSRPSPCSL